jgi:hypothetical protein
VCYSGKSPQASYIPLQSQIVDDYLVEWRCYIALDSESFVTAEATQCTQRLSRLSESKVMRRRHSLLKLKLMLGKVSHLYGALNTCYNIPGAGNTFSVEDVAVPARNWHLILSVKTIMAS